MPQYYLPHYSILLTTKVHEEMPGFICMCWYCEWEHDSGPVQAIILYFKKLGGFSV